MFYLLIYLFIEFNNPHKTVKTQGEQVDCMARSGLYHSRPASITGYTNELNTNRPSVRRKARGALEKLSEFIRVSSK